MTEAAPVTRFALSSRMTAGRGEGFRLKYNAFLPKSVMGGSPSLSVFRIDGLSEGGVWELARAHILPELPSGRRIPGRAPGEEDTQPHRPHGHGWEVGERPERDPSYTDLLGLTDTMGIPTPRLRNLVEALDTNEWQATLGGVILEAYKPLLEDLDLEKGTEQQLADAFRARGNVSGNTLTMAVRFFLGALDNAGVERSPYFRAPKRPPAKKHATASHQNGGAEPDGDADDSAAVASDPEVNAETNKSGERWPSQPFLLPTRSQPIVLEAPRDLSLAEWKIIDSFVRGMIELRGQAAPSPADDTVNGD